ncbi:MFS transporter, partial [Streptomyces sp. NRRL F-5123]|uniref:MFS transporter n=1 Tax=Streptomyces sp. NRRL F-5123 TaxID=1463856 RepID=UPI0004E14BD8
MSRPARQPASRPNVILAIVLFSTFAYSLLQSLINPVLPQLQAELHTTQSMITWVVTAFLLSAAVFTPILGRLGDRYGKDRILVLALVALAVGSLVSALATDISAMIVGRAIQGIGGSVIPLVFGIIRDELPRERVPGAVGLASALIAVGGGVGLLLSGPLVDWFGLRALFWIPLVAIVGAAVAAKIVVPPSPSRIDGPISWLSAALMAGGLLALLVPLTQGAKWGWGSGKVIGTLIAAALLLATWVRSENRSASPLVDMRMMRIPAVWTGNLVSMLIGMGLFAVFGFLPAFLQSPSAGGYGFDASPTEAGLFLMPMTITMFFAGLLAVRITRRVGARAVLSASAVLITASLALLAFLHQEACQVVVSMALLGLGFGCAVSTLSNVIVEAVPPEQTGIANGVNANVRTIGGAIGAALMGGIISTQLAATGLPTDDGYTYGFGALTLAAIGAVLASLLIPKAHPATA